MAKLSKATKAFMRKCEAAYWNQSKTQSQTAAQLKTRIPRELITLMRAEACAYEKSMEGIMLAILRAHFAFKPEVRRQLYSWLPKKHMGRKIT